MLNVYVVYAGRPWPVDQESDVLRQVGRFSSLDEALSAFSGVEFHRLPVRDGRLRWRGWSPQSGLIIQIERPVSVQLCLAC
ncbi:MAG: hypothetical protein Q4G45_01900 [Actinomycetia bacterium]|nr:hypothetical protein [Actinomycetes bacterium]